MNKLLSRSTAPRLNILIWSLLVVLCVTIFPTQLNASTLPAVALPSKQADQAADTDSESRRAIVVLGDSISASYGIQREQGWVHLLDTALAQREESWFAVNASISGETTGGGAHPGGPIIATDRYQVWVPTGRAINPITKTNWEGTGVIPNEKVAAAEALDKAKELAKLGAKNYKNNFFQPLETILNALADQKITTEKEVARLYMFKNSKQRMYQFEARGFPMLTFFFIDELLYTICKNFVQCQLLRLKPIKHQASNTDMFNNIKSTIMNNCIKANMSI